MWDVRALFLFQLTFLSGALLVSIARPALGNGVDRHWGAAAARLDDRLLPLWIGLLAIGGSLAVSTFVRFPHPWVQDEFSYLLAGDTFASGRLANPTHDLWPFFDTFHVLQVPTYASKYPPGQGLLLALGQLVGGDPVVGVWFGVGLACAAICWMLQTFVSPKWVIAGGLLAAANFSFFSPWTQTFVVNALSATGGALVIGGFGRLRRRPRALHGIPIGIGWLILSLTRPFEGLVFSLPLIGLMAFWFLSGKRQTIRPGLYSAVAVIASILALGAAAQAYYNRAVTGSYTVMPYAEYQRQNPGVSEFLWHPVEAVPEFNNEVRRLQHVAWSVPHREEQSTPGGYFSVKLREFVNAFAYLLQFSLWIPILVVLSFRKSHWEKLVVLIVASVSTALLFITWVEYRMLAPLAGPLVLLAVTGLKRIHLWAPRGRRVGRSFARAIILTPIVSLPLGLAPFMQESPNQMARDRATILRGLEQTGTRHLVVVRYRANHNYHEEWVYNRADIDAATVVWARERSPTETERLLDYYQDRSVWLLEPDAPERRLRPYASEGDNR